MRCGARVRKKRSPALRTRARARRRGGIPDRPGSLRSNARQKLAIAEHRPGQSGGQTGVAKFEQGRWGRSSRSDLARFFVYFFLENVKKNAAARARRVRAIPHHKELRSLRLRTKTETKTKNKNQANQKVTPVQNACIFLLGGRGRSAPFLCRVSLRANGYFAHDVHPRAGRVRFDGAFF